MLELFRKYQKGILGVTAVVVIASFTFFGAHDAVDRRANSNEQEDQTAFMKLADNSIITWSQARLLRQLLCDKDSLMGESLTKNYLLKNKILPLLSTLGSSKEQLALLQASLQEKRKIEREFIPFRHSKAQFLSVEGLWQRFDPTFYSKYRAYQNYLQQEESREPLDENGLQKELQMRVALFTDQEVSNVRWLQQLLYYQEQQLFPSLPSEVVGHNLQPFGYSDLESWLGNAAIEAAMKGFFVLSHYSQQANYQLSLQQVKEWLLYRLIHNSSNSKKGEPLSAEMEEKQGLELYQNQLQSYRVTEEQYLSIWQKILSVKGLLEDIEASVQFFPDLYQDYVEYTKEFITCQCYQLPKVLQMSTLNSLQELEAYLAAISPRKGIISPNTLAWLPEQYYPTDQIAQETPALVKRGYRVRMAHLPAEDAQMLFTAREILNWMMESSNHQLLGAIAKDVLNQESWNQLFATAVEQEKFTHALNLLHSDASQDYVRLEEAVWVYLLRNDPQRVIDALAQREHTEQLLEITFAGQYIEPAKSGEQKLSSSIARLGDGTLLADLLDKVHLMESMPEEQALIKEMLKAFTPNGKDYYSFELVQKNSIPEVLSLEEARRCGIVQNVLKDQLKKLYQQNQERYKAPNGYYKPMELVKEELAQEQLKALLPALEQVSGGKVSLDKAPQVRTFLIARHYWELFQEKGALSEWVNASRSEKLDVISATATDLFHQWRMTQSEIKLQRGQRHPLLNWKILADKSNGQWAFIEPEYGAPVMALVTRSIEHADPLVSKEKAKELAERLHEEGSAEVQRAVVQRVMVAASQPLS
jgi:hypothetical protein